MYYKDLTAYEDSLPQKATNILNVGWLDKEHEFERGNITEGLLEKLREILMSEGIFESRLHQIRGVEPCPLCGVDDFPDIFTGTCELWIPSVQDDLYFATPSTVIHYIENHNYRPPKIFIDSVLRLSLDRVFKAEELYSAIAKKMANL